VGRNLPRGFESLLLRLSPWRWASGVSATSEREREIELDALNDVARAHSVVHASDQILALQHLDLDAPEADLVAGVPRVQHLVARLDAVGF
jgi:hypothetical protein